MIPLSTDDLPWFCDDGDPALAERLRAAAPALAAAEDAVDEPARDRAAVAALAEAGLFGLVAPADGQVRARSLCLARELLGWTNARADSIFAVQGLGVHPLLLAGSAEQRAAIPAFAQGREVAAFALTEPEAGSDVAAIAASARRDGEHYVLEGDKLFISNLGVARHATVFAQLVHEWLGVPFETISSMTGVEQLDLLDADRSVVIARGQDGSRSLSAVALP